MNPVVLVLLCGALIVVIFFALKIADKWAKGDFKTKPPKEEKIPDVETVIDGAVDVISETVDEIVQEVGDLPPLQVYEDTATAEDMVTAKVHTEPISASRKNRITDYHKNRWGDKSVELGDTGIGEPEEFTISKEEYEKLVALRDLFDKK